MRRRFSIDDRINLTVAKFGQGEPPEELNGNAPLPEGVTDLHAQREAFAAEVAIERVKLAAVPADDLSGSVAMPGTTL